MPSTITAAMASAISEPLPVKMRSFFSLSGIPLDRTRRRPASTQTSTKALRRSLRLP